MSSNQQNLLPGVPLVEAPFFEEMLGGGYLDSEAWRIACDLRENGFAVFDFPDPDFTLVSARIRKNLANRFNIDAWRRSDIRDLRIQDAWTFNADVHRIAANEAVRGLLSKLYGREAFPFQSLSFPVGTEQHFHTDSVHFSAMPERFMCGVWVALENIGMDQGPLLYYPGSHKWPIYTNEHIGHVNLEKGVTGQDAYDPVWRKLVETHKIKPVRFTPKAGQALIWAANLLHGGDVHKDRSKTRWSQVTHYYFENCCYYTPLMSDNPFGSVLFREPFNILTGQPVKNRYMGKLVPEEFLENTRPDRVAAFWDKSMPANFNPAAYLSANPDVAAAGVDALEHYRKFGRKEGRRLRVDAD